MRRLAWQAHAYREEPGSGKSRNRTQEVHATEDEHIAVELRHAVVCVGSGVHHLQPPKVKNRTGTERKGSTQTERQTHTQTETERQRDRETDRQTDTHTHIHARTHRYTMETQSAKGAVSLDWVGGGRFNNSSHRAAYTT